MEIGIDHYSMKRTSSFDLKLQDRWAKCEDSGLIKYSVKSIPTKVMGQLKFIVQGNFKRGELRRKPDDITSVQQAFNEKKFNFLKIDSDERLFYFDDPAQLAEDEDEGHKHQIVINNCPIEDCSCLLLPSIHQKLPQILTFEGIKLAAEVVMLSHSTHFKAAFNSLGGNCSVNHQHFQMYYLRNHLYLERAKLVHLYGPCWTVEDYPAKCFVFLMKNPTELPSLCQDIMKLVKYFLDENIAHNLFITRGASSEGSEGFESNSCIRFVLWARKFAAGAKNSFEVVPASSELSGQIIVWNPNTFDRFQTDDIYSLFEKNCTQEFEFVARNLENVFDDEE